MYILYFKSYEWECQMIIINKPRISEAFVQDIYHTLCFAKREISFEVSTFGGSLFWGDRYFRDLLTPVTYNFIASFEGSLISELYGNL